MKKIRIPLVALFLAVALLFGGIAPTTVLADDPQGGSDGRVRLPTPNFYYYVLLPLLRTPIWW